MTEQQCIEKCLEIFAKHGIKPDDKILTCTQWNNEPYVEGINQYAKFISMRGEDSYSKTLFVLDCFETKEELIEYVNRDYNIKLPWQEEEEIYNKFIFLHGTEEQQKALSKKIKKEKERPLLSAITMLFVGLLLEAGKGTILGGIFYLILSLFWSGCSSSLIYIVAGFFMLKYIISLIVGTVKQVRAEHKQNQALKQIVEQLSKQKGR